jgi:hypothetical protein
LWEKIWDFFGCSFLPFLGSFEATRHLLATITTIRKMGINNFHVFLIFISTSPCGFMVFD